MYCNVKGCKNNSNGCCEIMNYITISEDGECEDRFIVTNYNNKDVDEDE